MAMSWPCQAAGQKAPSAAPPGYACQVQTATLALGHASLHFSSAAQPDCCPTRNQECSAGDDMAVPTCCSVSRPGVALLLSVKRGAPMSCRPASGRPCCCPDRPVLSAAHVLGPGKASWPAMQLIAEAWSLLRHSSSHHSAAPANGSCTWYRQPRLFATNRTPAAVKARHLM